MPRPPDLTTQVLDFDGLATNIDPTDAPDGAAADQVNSCSMSPGELRIRQGIVPLTFEEL